MLSGRDQIRQVLLHPREKPLHAMGRSLLLGIPIALLVGIVQFFSGFFQSASPVAYLLTGVSLSLLLWGADRLWFSMVAPMFDRPFSIAAYLSRVPFWYLAGGIAFEAGILAAKVLGWVAIYEFPVKQIFDIGARIGVVTACVLQGMLYRSMQQIIRQSHPSGNHHES